MTRMLFYRPDQYPTDGSRPARRAASGEYAVGLRLAALCLLAAAGSAGAQPVELTLPAPTGAPQSIDFKRDPVLGFSRTATPAQPFLENLGKAVETHPGVLASIAEQQSVMAVRTQVRSGLFPQLDAQLVTARALAREYGDRTTIVESLTPKQRSDLNVSGEQLLYDFGATGNRISAANDRIKAAEAEVERVASQVALNAVAAYYDVLGYQTLYDISIASAARQSEILADVKTRVTQGLGAAGDTSRTEAVLADAEAQTARFERLLAQARGRYREAFGTDAPARLTRPLPPISQAQSLDAAQAMSRKSPAVLVALRRADAAKRDYRAARADGLPHLSAGINGTRYDVFTGSNYEVRGTVALRQSLFAGGRQRGIIDEAGAESRSAGFTADRIAQENERDAGIAFTDVGALTRTAATLESAYIANRRARDSYVEQFRVSRGSLIELLRAEQTYSAAATAYLQGIIELDTARYVLLSRTGEILPIAGVKLSASSM